MGKSDDMMRLVIIIGVVLSVWFAYWAAAQQIVDVHCHNIMSGYMEVLKNMMPLWKRLFRCRNGMWMPILPLWKKPESVVLYCRCPHRNPTSVILGSAVA